GLEYGNGTNDQAIEQMPTAWHYAKRRAPPWGYTGNSQVLARWPSRSTGIIAACRSVLQSSATSGPADRHGSGGGERCWASPGSSRWGWCARRWVLSTATSTSSGRWTGAGSC